MAERKLRVVAPTVCIGSNSVNGSIAGWSISGRARRAESSWYSRADWSEDGNTVDSGKAYSGDWTCWGVNWAWKMEVHFTVQPALFPNSLHILATVNHLRPPIVTE